MLVARASLMAVRVCSVSEARPVSKESASLTRVSIQSVLRVKRVLDERGNAQCVGAWTDPLLLMSQSVKRSEGLRPSLKQAR